MSCLQDAPEGTHVRVDLQPEDQREASQVDISWSGLAAADLTANQKPSIAVCKQMVRLLRLQLRVVADCICVCMNMYMH